MPTVPNQGEREGERMRTMMLRFAVDEDHIFIEGSRVARPVRISRSRWRGFWTLWMRRRLTPETLAEAARFLEAGRTDSASLDAFKELPI